jgi:hypothetical protein
MRIAALAALALVLVPSLAFAQPEDRRRSPTAEAATGDPCASAADQRPVVPSASPPGFDPRAPVPAGATPFTGIALPSRDPSRQIPLPPPSADTAYQDCRRQLGR